MIGGIYGYLAGAVLVLIGLGSAGVQVWKAGGSSVRAEYAARDAKAQAEAADAERAITARYRRKEQDQAAAIASVSQKYEKRIAANETAHAVAASLRLRIPDSVQASGDTTAKVAPAISICDGRATGELPESTSRFLWGEAARADAVAIQLSACQQVLIQDRQ